MRSLLHGRPAASSAAVHRRQAMHLARGATMKLHSCAPCQCCICQSQLPGQISSHKSICCAAPIDVLSWSIHATGGLQFKHQGPTHIMWSDAAAPCGAYSACMSVPVGEARRVKREGERRICLHSTKTVHLYYMRTELCICIPIRPSSTIGMPTCTAVNAREQLLLRPFPFHCSAF